jgi:hypothetical protein
MGEQIKAKSRTWFQFSLGDLVWLMLYIAMVAGVAGGTYRAREYALAEFNNEQAQADWQKWRSAVQDQKIEQEPVMRKVPKSTAPPTLVLLRDYYNSTLFSALVISSMMFASVLFFIRGALNSPTFVPRPDHPKRETN